MSNIYLRQMKELNVDVEQYSKLLDAPIFIVRRLVKGETLSEDMGLNEFIRNNILKKYNELETNKVETQSKVVALRIDDNKQQNDLLEWHKDFNYQDFMKKYNLTNKIMTDDLKIGQSTMMAITSPLKKYSPSEKIIAKVKNYLENFEKKEEKYKNECLNDVLKNILKDRLTEEEKKLIEIFGGKIC